MATDDWTGDGPMKILITITEFQLLRSFTMSSSTLPFPNVISTTNSSKFSLLSLLFALDLRETLSTDGSDGAYTWGM